MDANIFQIGNRVFVILPYVECGHLDWYKVHMFDAQSKNVIESSSFCSLGGCMEWARRKSGSEVKLTMIA